MVIRRRVNPPSSQGLRRVRGVIADLPHLFPCLPRRMRSPMRQIGRCFARAAKKGVGGKIGARVLGRASPHAGEKNSILENSPLNFPCRTGSLTRSHDVARGGRLEFSASQQRAGRSGASGLRRLAPEGGAR